MIRKMLSAVLVVAALLLAVLSLAATSASANDIAPHPSEEPALCESEIGEADFDGFLPCSNTALRKYRQDPSGQWWGCHPELSEARIAGRREVSEVRHLTAYNSTILTQPGWFPFEWTSFCELTDAGPIPTAVPTVAPTAEPTAVPAGCSQAAGQAPVCRTCPAGQTLLADGVSCAIPPPNLAFTGPGETSEAAAGIGLGLVGLGVAVLAVVRWKDGER